MSYSTIDPIIQSWAKSKNLKLFTMDRDWEIRSFRVDDSIRRGRNYKIWIEMPDSSGNSIVHVMNLDNPNNKKQFKTSKRELEEILDNAFKIAIGT